MFMSAGIRVSFLNTLLIISIENCFPANCGRQQTGWVEIQTFEWLVWRIMGRVRDKRLSSEFKPGLLSSARPAQLGFDDGIQPSAGKLLRIARSDSPYTHKLTGNFIHNQSITEHLPLDRRFYFLQIVGNYYVIKLRATQH